MRRRGLPWARTLLVLLCGVDCAWAQNSASNGFNLCVTPMKPTCIDMTETFKSKKNTSLCQDQMQYYTQATIDYRICMYREVERAVLQLNDALDTLKCKMPQHDGCRSAAADHQRSKP